MTNLKYDFIDEDHKRMHNALIAAGWSCENDERPKPSIDYWDWVYSLNGEYICFDIDDYHVFHVIKNFLGLYIHGKKFSELANILEQEMKEKIPNNFSHIKAGQWIKSLVTNNDREKDKWYQVEYTACDTLQYINNEGEFNTSFSLEEWDINNVRDNNPDDNTKEIKGESSPDIALYTDTINTKENIANRFMQIFRLAELQDKEFAEFIKNNDSNTYNYVDMYFDFLAIDRGLK